VSGIPPALLVWSRSRNVREPVAEHRFAPPRRWRFDWAWPDLLIAVEINGGVWSRGRHVRGKGYLADLEKINAAQALGWRVGQFAPNQTGEMLAWLDAVRSGDVARRAARDDLILRLAERIYAAHEVLTNLAERRRNERVQTGGQDHRQIRSRR
jgi:hypothetical protein